jgi:vitamin B12 transporter
MSFDTFVRRLGSTLLLLAPSLAAQTPGDTVVVRPIIVTATRAPTPLDAVASAVTVLRGTDLRARGIATVADALRTVPGASVVQSGSSGAQTSLFLRGGESDYVKVLVDGVPLNGPGGSFDWADLTTDDVERIEIVRGPGSVLYGSDAVAGVVQIFTRGGAGRFRGTAGVEAGRYGALTTRAELGGAAGGVSYSLGGSRFTTDGLYPFNNHFRNASVDGRLATAGEGRTGASLTARYGDAIYHFPTGSDGLPTDSNQFTATRELTLALAGRRTLTPRLDAQLLFGLRQTLPRSENPPDTLNGDSFRSADTVRRFTGGALVNYTLAAAGRLTAGVEREVERQRGRSLFVSSAFGSFPDSINVHRANTGYYAQALLPLRSTVDLTLGARLDDNQRFGRFWTWRAGAAYRVARGTRVRASAGTGFKEPAFIENYGGFGTIGNPGLRPERSRSWEVGAEQTALAGRMSLSATYFDQRFRDLIDFTFAPAPPDTVNYFNVAGARASGLEVEAGARGGAGVEVALAYTYLRTRVTDPGFDTGPDAAFDAGERLLRRPSHQATLRASVPVARRGSAGLAVRYVGRRDDLDFALAPGSRRVTLPAYTRLDLSSEWRLWAGMTARVRVENVLDARYQEVRGFRTPRRALFVGGEARY